MSSSSPPTYTPILNSLLIILGTIIAILWIIYFIYFSFFTEPLQESAITTKIPNQSSIKFNPSNQLGIFYTPSTQSFTRPVNTPLNKLKSPYLQITSVSNEDLPNFLCYKFNVLTRILDQGNCGSCWAIVTADMTANRSMIRTGGRFRKSLSAQQILSCFGKKNGCDGKSPEDALFWLQSTGTLITLDSVFPYKQEFSTTITTNCPLETLGIGLESNSTKSVVKFIPEFNYDKTILESNVENMKKELFVSGVIFGIMVIYSDFFNFKGGVYTPSKDAKQIGGHAVIIVGYCDKGVDSRPKYNSGYWICKNSWGKSWPKYSKIPGYFLIEMGSNICGIESRVGFANPDIPETDNLSFQFNMPAVRWTNIDTANAESGGVFSD
jgi:C1A family cysteine protease